MYSMIKLPSPLRNIEWFDSSNVGTVLGILSIYINRLKKNIYIRTYTDWILCKEKMDLELHQQQPLVLFEQVQIQDD